MIILNKRRRKIELFLVKKPKENVPIEPILYGHLKFKSTPAGPRIKRFIIINKKSKPYPPSKAIKLLRSHKVFLANSDKNLEKFLDDFNIQYKKLIVCNHCLIEKRVTILTEKNSYKYNNQAICKECAEDIIKMELRYISANKSLIKKLKNILERIKDVEKILKIFEPFFDPVENPEFTLIDKIECGKDKELKVSELNIPKKFKFVLNHLKIRKLLPVQYLAIKNGLIEGKNLMVVSATASGKTLIGELVGIPSALEGKKFIYLTPLVALANQKYREFKSKYSSLGLKTAIKVGKNRIKAKGELKIHEDDIRDADIVVGTYEGIDFLLRSGKSKHLGDPGVIVIDEIHMLEDRERGPRLNGMIKRFMKIFPNSQIIALSATVENAEEIAKKFGLKLVKYEKRPVPLEKHLILLKNNEEKKEIIAKLIKKEYNNISKKGFRGQTIVFTNSRMKTKMITNYLRSKGIKAAAYHAGLPYHKREKIEKEFASQNLEAVVTTAALSAGVDFPASQVIFETLLMGNKWIENNEFQQMLGRAGRPSYHDRGIVYILAEIGMNFNGETEESKAVELLEGNLDPVDVDYTDEDVLEHVLADITSGSVKKPQDLTNDASWPIDSKEAVQILEKHGLLKKFKPTEYGFAVSKSFLKLNEAKYIEKNIGKKDAVKIAVTINPFENAYLSKQLHKQLIHNLGVKFSSRLFADSTLDILSKGKNIVDLDKNLQKAVIRLQMDFISCKCKYRPFCGCTQKKFSEYIINLRLKGKDPIEISKIIISKYKIQTYSGDIFNWLDNILRTFEGMKRIASAFNINEEVEKLNKIIKKIEEG
ncbi:DEAD/DEAH box helicase domain protein [Methanothermus fervidus DSM 2088]|uniref:DEAD/DEAH box helicase domain protein n=1 Tax=Methanothermus fervidus (strain ATCC 43054 / DSM 2088 / JCM 10308 / V24 S) TaxID=523846 RepID=E3GWL9_METFV|nr:DUF5814 domain-containing protein [Methanothermus fervidus]ADP76833.1 DEAD/DEAH box helicase domain protein [Methanothermus fervidus DSM 2088]